MTKHFLFFCIAIFICSINLSGKAQEAAFSIKGIVVDSLSQKPGEYFTVALRKDATVLKSVVTDAQGQFKFDGVAAGTYTLVFGSVGYAPKQLELNVTKHTDVNKVLISPQGSNLSEVAIVGSKPIIKQEPDRITYDLEADPESKILTVLDMMRKVPLLSVDADDNIKMKGSGNYKILINGKPSGVIARDPKEFLKNMPAANVKKIEVITTPPSKYDSEGLAGLINIITAKKVANGYNGSVGLRGSFPQNSSANTNFTLQQGKFGINLYAGTGLYMVNDLRMFDKRYSKNTSLLNNLNAYGVNSTDNRWGWAGGEMSYEIDSLNLITAEITPYKGFNLQGIVLEYDLLQNNTAANYDMDSQNRYEWAGVDYSLNYQLGFKDKKEHLLTFSYKYYDNAEPQYTDVKFKNAVNFFANNYKQENKNISKEQTIQVDYVNPFKNVNFEIGAKAIFRSGDSRFDFSNYNAITGNYVVDPSMGNTYVNNQDIYSLYNTYTIKLKDWSLKMGARLEHTAVIGDFESTNTKVETDYTNIVPAVSFNRTLSTTRSVSLGYTQRIRRPGIYDLNPFVDKSRPMVEVFGNPDLAAVLSNNFELSFSDFKKGTLNVSLSYNFANNTQQQVYRFDEVENLTRISYYNIGKDKLLGVNLSYNYPITKLWNVSLNGNLNHVWLEGMINGLLTNNKGVTGYATFNTAYKFENTWKLSMTYNYGAPSVLLQGKTNDNYYLAFGGSKDLIKDKLILSAMLVNPFKKYRAYKSQIDGYNFTQERMRDTYFRRGIINLNWKFGKLEGSIKKNERSINNDDVKAK